MSSSEGKKQPQQNETGNSSTVSMVKTPLGDISADVPSKSLTSIGFVSVSNNSTPKSTGTGGGRIRENIIQDINQQQQQNQQQILDEAIPVEPAENHYVPKDVACFIIVCPAHQTLAVQQIINSYYFPSVQIEQIEHQSVAELCTSLIQMLVDDHERYLSNGRSKYQMHLDLVGVYRVKIPKLDKFIVNFTFRTYFHMTGSNDQIEKPCICKSSRKPVTDSEVVWIPYKNIPADQVWAGELLEYFSSENKWEPKTNKVFMVELDDEYVQDIYRHRIPPNNIEDLQVAVHYLFNEFVVQCFPGQTMAKSSFFYMCDKINGQITMEIKQRMFRTFDRQQRNFLDFADLLNGFILFESQNMGTSIRDHLDYIFRYYDTDGREKLRQEQFFQLMRDLFIVHLEDPNAADPDIDIGLIERLWEQTFPEIRVGECLMTYDQFVDAFLCLDETITSSTRFPMPSFQLFDKIIDHFNCRTRGTAPTQQLVDLNIFYGQCSACQEPSANQFTLSSSLIYLSAGSIVMHRKLKRKPGESTAAVFHPEIFENNIFCLANDFLNRIEKMNHSIHYRSGLENNERALKNYFFEDENLMLHYIHLLSEFAALLLENQSPIIKVRSPGYVFGSLSGSLMDLICFRRRTFRSFPFLNPGFLVFLGNHIGPRANMLNNFSCFMYLVCMKIMAPNRVVILRSPVESQQTLHSIRKELSNLPICDDIARLVHRIFEHLPFACIVDEKIFISNFVPPPCGLSVAQLQCVAHWAKSRIPSTNIDRMLYSIPVMANMRREFSYRIFDPELIPIYEWTMEDLLFPTTEKSGTENVENENDRIKEECRQIEKFLTKNRMSLLISGISAKNFSGPSNASFTGPPRKSPEGFTFGPGCHLIKLDSSRHTTAFPACAFIDRNRVRFIVYEAK